MSGVFKLEKKTNIDKYLNKIDPKYYPLMAFLMTGLVYTLILSAADVLGNGVFIIEYGDLYVQIIPLIMQLREVILGKHSLWYSWNIGIGSGSIGNYAYFTLSPFNIFYIILGSQYIHLASALVIITKAATSALTFQIFISRFLRRNYYETVLFSMLYALNGFVICYYHVPIFMDAVLIFPVIILGILNLVRDGRIFVLTFSYAYLFFVQLYMGYVVGINSFIIFILYYFYITKGKSIKYRKFLLIKYVYSVFIALGITAFIWFPAVINILQYNSSEPIYENPLKCNVLTLLNNMFLGQYQSQDGFAPFYYAGLLTALAVPAFFRNKWLSKRKRMYYGMAICIFTVIMLLQPLNIAIQGFDLPNKDGYRYSFVVSFILLVILSQEFLFLRGCYALNRKYLITYAIVYSIIFVGSKMIFVNKWGEEYDSNNIIVYIVNLVFIFLWYIYLKYGRIRISDTLTKQVLITTLVIVECCINIFIIQNRLNVRVTTLVDNYYINAEQNTIKKIKDTSTNDYNIRTIYEDRYITNVALLNDLSSLAFFSPILNKNLTDCLINLGFAYTSNYFNGNGWSPITASILGIDYIIDGENIISDNENEQVVIEANKGYFQNYVSNTRVLPLAFAVDTEILNYTHEESVFENQNNLLSKLCGRKVKCFIPTQMRMEGADIEEINDYIRIYNDRYPEGECVVAYLSYEESDKPIYVNLYNDFKMREDNEYRIGTLLNAKSDGDLGSTNPVTLYPNQLFRAIHHENGFSLFAMIIPQKLQYVEYKKGYFSYYDFNEFDRAYKELSNKGMNITAFEDGYVSGNIECDNDCILFTSIPYEKGWNVYVDGIKEEVVPLVEDAFVGAKLSRGRHDIILSYEPPGRRTGMYLSIGTFFVIYLLKVIVNKKNTN